MAGTAAPARAADVVVRAGGVERRVGEAALRSAADVPAGTVVLRSQPGPGETIAHPPAASLPRVLELAGVAPPARGFVAVRRPNGTLAAIGAGDLATAPPLLWVDADSVRFYRPPRDGADLNAADNFATAGEDLALRVRQGALLDVRVRVRPERPRAGERVRLEAQVGGAPGGSAIAVRWRFGDGAESGGAATTHRWRSPGTYAVVATAEGDDAPRAPRRRWSCRSASAAGPSGSRSAAAVAANRSGRPRPARRTGRVAPAPDPRRRLPRADRRPRGLCHAGRRPAAARDGSAAARPTRADAAAPPREPGAPRGTRRRGARRGHRPHRRGEGRAGRRAGRPR